MAKEILGFDSQFLKQVKTLFQETNIEEIEIQEGEDIYFRVSRKKPQEGAYAPVSVAPMAPVVQNAPAPAATQTAAVQPQPQAPKANPYDDESKYFKIKSPIVGTFYDTPSPDSPPFVKAGDVVSPDTTVAIVEAMKVLNEIKAEIRGKIVEILKTHGAAVQAGDVLFIVEKM
jgi:acetyl-CoA carboxylase biotin carboxyl carrier protein